MFEYLRAARLFGIASRLEKAGRKDAAVMRLHRALALLDHFPASGTGQWRLMKLLVLELLAAVEHERGDTVAQRLAVRQWVEFWKQTVALEPVYDTLGPLQESKRWLTAAHAKFESEGDGQT